MEHSTFYRADQISDPHAVGLICVKKRNDKFNLTPVTSWNTFGNDDSAYITFALKNTSHSACRIVATRRFTFCIPDASLGYDVRYLGHLDGVFTDKLDLVPLEMEDLGDDYQALKASCVVYCCKLRQHIAYGDYLLFICEIADVYANEKLKPLFSYDSRSSLGGANRPKSVINDLKFKKDK